MLGLLSLTTHHTEILAETLHDDLSVYGSYLTVRYYTGPVPVEDPTKEFIKQLYGAGELTPQESNIKYDMAYSEYTGYLWTDEEINVGGHDLLTELKSHVGRYLYMEITFTRNSKIDT